MLYRYIQIPVRPGLVTKQGINAPLHLQQRRYRVVLKASAIQARHSLASVLQTHSFP